MQTSDRDEPGGLGRTLRFVGMLVLLNVLFLAGPPVRSLYTFVGFVMLYLAALGAWALTLRWAPPLSVRTIVALAIVTRLLMSVQAPSLSGDSYRSIWDGKVAASGVSPYASIPNDPKLAALREGWHGKLDRPLERSSAPPHAEILFLLAQMFGGLLTFKLMLIAFDVVTITLLSRMTDTRTLFGYATFPLLLFEGFWSAHLEVAAATMVTLAVVWLLRGRNVGAGIALAFATGFKVLPLAALPALLRGSARRLLFVAGFVLALTIPALPYLRGGPFMAGLGDYARSGSFNSPFYWMISGVLQHVPYESWAVHTFSPADSLTFVRSTNPSAAFLQTNLLARCLLGLAAVVSIGFAIRKANMRAAAVVSSLGILLLCSPAIYPWMWLPIVPLAMVTRQRGWLAAAMLAPISYLLGVPVYRSLPFVVFTLCYLLPAVIWFSGRPPASANATSVDEWHSAATPLRKARGTSRR